MDWRVDFEQALANQNIEKAVSVLQTLKTNHANTPKTADKVTALDVIRTVACNNPKEIYYYGNQLANISDDTANELGAILLGETYQINPSEITTTLYRLADNPNWEVREWVASACGIILTRHFKEFYPVLKGWVTDESPNVRRAVALATMTASKTKNKAYVWPLIDLIEPLLSDRDTYVKKNLGPFAIGAGLLKYYPDEVLNKANVWVQSKDEQVLWNVAMIFSAAEGAKHKEEAVKILQVLNQDSRKYVRKALEAAIKNLNKKLSEDIKIM